MSHRVKWYMAALVTCTRLIHSILITISDVHIFLLICRSLIKVKISINNLRKYRSTYFVINTVTTGCLVYLLNKSQTKKCFDQYRRQWICKINSKIIDSHIEFEKYNIAPVFSLLFWEMPDDCIDTFDNEGHFKELSV